jgi:hypothetical protein
MIEIKEGRYFHCMCFISGKKCDWMGMVWTDDTKEWYLTCRFNYHHSYKPFDGQDVRSWYELKGTKEEIMNKLEQAEKLVSLTWQSKPCRVPISSDDATYIEQVLFRLPFIHVEGEEARWQGSV